MSDAATIGFPSAAGNQPACRAEDATSINLPAMGMQQIKLFRNCLAGTPWGRLLCRVHDVTGYGGGKRDIMGVSFLVPKARGPKRGALTQWLTGENLPADRSGSRDDTKSRPPRTQAEMRPTGRSSRPGAAPAAKKKLAAGSDQLTRATTGRSRALRTCFYRCSANYSHGQKATYIGTFT